MARYELRIKQSAKREIESLPRHDRQRVVAKIEALADAPRPEGCRRLTGQDLYRIRQGNHRIIYEVKDAVLLVHVVRVAHRREVYDRF